MKLELDRMAPSEEVRSFQLRKIEDPSELIDGTYSAALQRRILARNRGMCDTFLLEKAGEPVGSLSVMYAGGDELEYRIRNIDAFFYNVFIVPPERGKGYCGLMLRLVADELRAGFKREAYLAVSRDNRDAIRAYEKAGFVLAGKTWFFRLLKHNIPYRVL